MAKLEDMQLYLNTYGTYLHVKDGMLEVRIPKEGGGYDKPAFAVQKVTSIIMTTSCSLSTDAVKIALENNIDIIFADHSGFPLGRVWHSKLGSTTRIRKRQLEASIGALGLKWTTEWLGEKLGNQADFLRSLKKHRSGMTDYLEGRADKIDALLQSIRLQGDAATVDEVAETLRGLEGTAGRLYFEALSKALPEAYRFAGRSSRPAQDDFNAFLNYGYGVLYGRVEKALMVAGLDPYVGFLHRDDYNQKSMVFDFIEPYRIHVEVPVFRLFSAKKVNQSHTEPLANGITLAKPGKQLLVEQLNDYLEVQTIRYKGRNQTRAMALQRDAHRFANQLIGK